VTDERRAIVEHRLRRAVEALEDARVLARASRGLISLPSCVGMALSSFGPCFSRQSLC